MQFDDILRQLNSLTDPAAQLGLTISDARQDMGEYEKKCLLLQQRFPQLSREELQIVGATLFDTLTKYSQLRQASRVSNTTIAKASGNPPGIESTKTMAQILADVTILTEQAKQENSIRLLAELLTRVKELLDDQSNE